MASTMTEKPPRGWVPEDTFGGRLAVLRQHFGWNVKQAADHCGILGENWRRWEKTGSTPRGIYEIVDQIVKATGVDRTWLLAGGPLSPEGTTPEVDPAGTRWSGSTVRMTHDLEVVQPTLFDDLGPCFEDHGPVLPAIPGSHPLAA
jgi:hypothetical protein